MSDIICVTHRQLCREDFLERVEKIAAARPRGLILREKDLPEEEYRALARRVLERTGLRKYVVAGGETSDAVSRGLGVRTMRIWQEIEAGVPLMTAVTHDGHQLLLVLKSGSFGSPAFLRRSADALRGRA